MGTLPYGLTGPAQPGVDYSQYVSLQPTDTSVVAGEDSSGSNSSGWLSGLGDLFQGIGTAVSSGLAASNIPKLPNAGGGWVFNPTTGQYYNPATGQALTATGTLTSAAGFTGAVTGQSSFLLLALVGLVAFFLIRKSG
jgi:hypothetical protein